MNSQRWWGLLAFVSVLLLPFRARAFCGFYVAGSGDRLVNGATQVVLLRSGVHTVLSMQNEYRGPAQNFAMVVPVPVVLQRENVRTLPRELFQRVEQLSAPRLVEYWEQDPCPSEAAVLDPPPQPTSAMVPRRSNRARGSAPIDLGVRIEAQFAVGEYEILILSATQSSGLETWLRQNQYNIPEGAAEVLAPYIRDGWKFFVARVAIDRVQRREDGSALLSPLRFHYDSPEFRLPVRLGLLNAGAAQDLIVYILHPSRRFEVSNYRNVFIPTNLEVNSEVRSNFASFYAQLFDRTLSENARRAVVTEYVWESNSCDPCPAPTLTAEELATLGQDITDPPRQEEVQVPIYEELPVTTPLLVPVEKPSKRPRVRNVMPGPARYQTVRRWITPNTNMVLTRLHTRYNRETLTEDLVFREANGVVGGRELLDANGSVERGAQPSPTNNFQARYIVRHPWEGPITCAHPRRGVWGGPPSGVAGGVLTAQDLARASRTGLNLAAMLQPNATATRDAGAAPSNSVVSDAGRATPPAPRSSSCLCAAPGKTSRSELRVLLVLVLFLAQRRRGEKLSSGFGIH